MSNSNETIPIDSSFQFIGGKKFYETEHAWARVRIKRDPVRGDHYVDVLMGRKGSKVPHIHLGLNGNGTERFRESRGRLHSFGRRAVDSERGLLEDRVDYYMPTKGDFTFKFTVFVNAPSRTIRVLFEEAQISESGHEGQSQA